MVSILRTMGNSWLFTFKLMLMMRLKWICSELLTGTK